jgi:hypothetical protein
MAFFHSCTVTTYPSLTGFDVKKSLNLPANALYSSLYKAAVKSASLSQIEMPHNPSTLDHKFGDIFSSGKAAP